MISYIKIQNYKSFTDAYFNFIGKNNIPKKLVIIYGENGSGKTNIIDLFSFIQQTFETMQLKNVIMELLEEQPESLNPNQILQLKSFIDIDKCISKYKTKKSTGNMLIELGFMFNGKTGCYVLEFDESQIVHEKLEYTLNKNKGVYFDISAEKVKIHSSLFKNDYYSDINTKINKYWGKHSLMSILYYDFSELSTKYIHEQISLNMQDVMNYLSKISCYINGNFRKWSVAQNKVNFLRNPNYGIVNEENLSDLKQTETIINNFFCNIYKDIKSVNYHIYGDEKEKKYELFFNKLISGQVKEISYLDESCGTKNLINLLPFFISVIEPGVVAIDEIDNGIHEVLLKNIFDKLVEQNQDQLIVTTHNSSFINCYEYKDNIYFINIDENGHRQLKSLTDFNFRIQPDSNVLARYLEGEFNGLPWNNMKINFNELTKR